MKKFILPIILFLFFLLSPVTTSAQSSNDKYQLELAKDKCIGKKYDECNQKFKSDVCLPLQNDYVAWVGCQNELLDKIEACDKEIDSTYPPCKGILQNQSQQSKLTPEPESSAQVSQSEGPQGPPAKEVTCEEVKNIMMAEGGTEDCQNPIVDPTRGGVWCNLPLSRETVEQYQNLYTPKYTFTPETCSDIFDLTGGFDQGSVPSFNQENNTSKTGLFNGKANFIGRLFGSNPFQTWLNLRGFAEFGSYIYTGAALEEMGSLFSPQYAAFVAKERDAEKRAQIGREYLGDWQKRFLKLEGRDSLTDWKESFDKPIRATKEPVIIHQDSATMQVMPLYGEDGILEKNSKEFWKLKSGGVDVIVEPKAGETYKLQTPNAEVVVIGTKFSVFYDPAKLQTMVIVYQGSVQVKSRDGETKTVSPVGNDSMVVVISQKLSLIKLGFVGLVLAAVLGGVVLFLKKRSSRKGMKKKKLLNR